MDYEEYIKATTIASLTEEVSDLSLQKLLDQAKLITTVPSGVLKPLCDVAFVGMDEAWVISHEKIIRRVDIHGSVRDSVTTTCKTWPNGITVTGQGELVYSIYDTNTVNIVRHGRTEKLITTPRGWKPEKGDTVKQEIDRDEDGEPIYKGGEFSLRVVENNNGDVCASDSNAQAVVVVNKSGRVRFRYDGASARRKKSFYPAHIVTDSMSQIIVADFNNACLHILDQNGQFLKCVDNCGLNNPVGLSVDSEGRLWVGLYDTVEVKVLQYLK